MDPDAGNFIEERILEDRKKGRFEGKVHTRFPPEPNGYLHFGHAKSIFLNFGLARDYGGICNLRFDDTNPVSEDTEYVDSILDDVKWLGFDWQDHLYYASDYFDELYRYAELFIEHGLAYVDSLTPGQIREHRGTLTQPGRNSPHRDRTLQENLSLFREMRDGQHPDGTHALRLKIDMAAPNINMRDPVIYRIRHAHHHRSGDKWCVYPMYDYTHCISDALENITHSVCTLEFEDHRPLYEWFLDNLPVPSRPRQIEFARLNLTYTVLSKRRLLLLVQGGHVSGWDDPRMPTRAGMRRRGYTPESIRTFCERIGVAKFNSTIDFALLEHCVRNILNKTAPRYMGVLNPLKVVIENYPEGESEELDAINNPEDPAAGTRKVPFTRELYIEREDFMVDPPRKFFRLGPGREVRLRYAFFITCNEVIKDEAGDIIELRCSYDPATRGGDAPDGRRPKATLHWVSAERAVAAKVRLYAPLFVRPDPGADGDLLADLNPDSEVVVAKAMLEPAAAQTPLGETIQFERLGYFCPDPDSTSDQLVFNRTVTLRDTWAKLQAKGRR